MRHTGWSDATNNLATRAYCDKLNSTGHVVALYTLQHVLNIRWSLAESRAAAIRLFFLTCQSQEQFDYVSMMTHLNMDSTIQYRENMSKLTETAWQLLVKCYPQLIGRNLLKQLKSN